MSRRSRSLRRSRRRAARRGKFFQTSAASAGLHASAQISEQPDGTFLLDGMLAVRDANQRFGLTLPEGESYTTVAGFLLARSGRILKPGETVEHDGARFTVERVDKLRIRRVRFLPAPEQGRAGEHGHDGSNATLSSLLPLAYPLACLRLLEALALA